MIIFFKKLLAIPFVIMAAQGKIIEDNLLDKYGGRGLMMPQTLMFDHISPATRLLEKRRQMFEVQEALNGQKEEFSRREDAFRRREDGLRRKDLELQESLIKFNKFLQENESKRNRALKRATDERKQREGKELEIRRLETQLKSKLDEEARLNEELTKNIKYQDYLENVIQNLSKFFPEISDILNRFKTLKDANKYLLEKSLNEESVHENMQREYNFYRKTKENEMLNANNEIAELQVKLDHVKSKSMRLQAEVDQKTGETSDKALLLGQILSSAANTLDRCEENFRRRHNKPMIDRSSEKFNEMTLAEQGLRTAGKLDEISNFMTDFRAIYIEYEDEFGVLDLDMKNMNINKTTAASSGGQQATHVAVEASKTPSGNLEGGGSKSKIIE